MYKKEGVSHFFGANSYIIPLFIRATMPDGKQVWYDVLGNKLLNE